MIDVLEIPDFLDAATCRLLRAELREAAGAAATVTGYTQAQARVAHDVRKATRLAIPDALNQDLVQRLAQCRAQLAAYFAVTLDRCETPQFLRYQSGDFFVAHQDGNTSLLHDDTRFRKISVIIFLSGPSVVPEQDCYGGGELVFHGPYPHGDWRRALAPVPGTLLAFRSETTHEVAPVTHGERYSIVSWFRADEIAQAPSALR